MKFVKVACAVALDLNTFAHIHGRAKITAMMMGQSAYLQSTWIIIETQGECVCMQLLPEQPLMEAHAWSHCTSQVRYESGEGGREGATKRPLALHACACVHTASQRREPHKVKIQRIEPLESVQQLIRPFDCAAG